MVRPFAVVLLGGLLFTPSITVTPSARTLSAPAATSSYVVSLRPGAGDPAAVAAEQARALGFSVTFLYRSALTGYAADLTPAAHAALKADPRVAAVEADTPVAATEQVTPQGIDRVDADASVTASIDDIDAPRVEINVAVLDTGIDTEHPDLSVAGGADCAKGRGYDDEYGHGTHIAGVIGALDNGVGVVGVAPGARLFAVRVLDEHGKGTTRELLCGVDWVTSTRSDADPNNDIEVANLSLGATGGDDGQCGQVDGDLLHQAICRSVAAGVTYIVAAGNTAEDAIYSAPASYDEVITVSALADADGLPGSVGGSPSCREDEDDTLAAFSNYGVDVDLIAPGVCIYSTLPIDGAMLGSSGGYGTLTGTSFAAPHVAGAAALYLNTHPGTSPSQVRDALVGSGTTDWNNVDDPDGIKEPLCSVASF